MCLRKKQQSAAWPGCLCCCGLRSLLFTYCLWLLLCFDPLHKKYLEALYCTWGAVWVGPSWWGLSSLWRSSLGPHGAHAVTKTLLGFLFFLYVTVLWD